MSSSTYDLTDVTTLSETQCSEPIRADLKYATLDNLTGRVINGYTQGVQSVALLVYEAAKALCAVQNELNQDNLGILIYDAYRPPKAVDDLYKWANSVETPSDLEILRQSIHYPHLNRPELFAKGYIKQDSDHCKGNTVDMTLIDLTTEQTLPFGSCFDYMDPKSHISTIDIHPIAIENRTKLRDAMAKHQFKPFEQEWWHFTYQKAALKQIVDIDITNDLKGIGCDAPELEFSLE